MLRIFANFSFAYSLFRCTFTWIFVMWDYVFVLTCTSDVASRGASDSSVQLKLTFIT